jgi:hypothetical protein
MKDTSTAGFVLIMSYSCRSILDQIDAHTVDESWRKCEEVLAVMSSFSVSARNSLQFLKVTHQHIVQKYTGMSDSRGRLCGTNLRAGSSRNEDITSLPPNQLQRKATRQSGPEFPLQPAGHTEEHIPRDTELNAPINPFTSWEATGLGQEEFGFLGRFDLPDLASWFSDVPDIP